MNALGPYFIRFGKEIREDFSEYLRDASGLPFSAGRDGRPVYNPVTISQYGLHRYNQWFMDSGDADEKAFLKAASWLCRSAEKGPADSAVWPYLFDIPFYGIRHPWVSGMAQAEAVSLLLRAHQHTGEAAYLKTARRAYSLLPVPVQEGGVLSAFPDGGIFIEEYPSPAGITAVLNGALFGILGVIDFSACTEDAGTAAFLRRLLDSLRANIGRYDCGYWSRYDLHQTGRLSSRIYHKLHILQLTALAERLQEPWIRAVLDRWEGYAHSPGCRLRWAGRKILEKISLSGRGLPGGETGGPVA
ncbi:hypothetical protein JW906_15945 [bacterium]|nr:hypothetical protein [bacterium]